MEFRFEPLSIVVEWRDIEAAQCLVSIRMEVPWSDSNRILLSKEYVRSPVDLADRKIGRELERFLVV